MLTEAETEVSISQEMSRVAGNHQKLGERHGTMASLEHLEEAWPCSHPDFRLKPPELWENTCLLFDTIQLVVICHGSPRPPTQPQKQCSVPPNESYQEINYVPISHYG